MQRRIGVLALLLLGFVLAAFLPSPLLAQYMYIDANGDGIHNAADVMSPLGVAVPVDVWLDRTHNRDGSLAVCNTGDGDLSVWNSYAVHINALGGTVSFSNFVNLVTPFAINCSAGGQGFISTNLAMAACRAGQPMLSDSRVKMFSMTVTGVSGTPFLEIVRSNALDFNATSFGTQCFGSDFDNTYKLGTDWFDADGLGAACASGCPPFLYPIANMSVNEGATASQTINASDPDGGSIQFQKVSGPMYMTVTTSNPTAGIGAIVLTPGFFDAASGVPASVRATDGSLFSNVQSFQITVLPVNRAPTAAPGGPYSGVTGIPIAFDGTASSDPDGDPLTFSWNFGDLNTATGPTPAHTYAAEGIYVVSLTVSDGTLSGTANTVATIADVFEARAFTTRANRLLRLGSGKPYWTIQIEPIASSFNIGEVGLGTIRMKSVGTGSVSEIGVVLGKTSLQGDADGNGVPDIAATFAKTDLQALFSNLSGSTSVPVTIEGSITSGGIFRAQADIGVVASGGPAAVSIFPNPLNPRGEVTFAVAKPGRVRVDLFDVSGRLVRVLMDREVSQAGGQSCTIDGRNREGASLASGVYYVRVSSSDAVVTQRVAIVK